MSMNGEARPPSRWRRVYLTIAAITTACITALGVIANIPTAAQHLQNMLPVSLAALIPGGDFERFGAIAERAFKNRHITDESLLEHFKYASTKRSIGKLQTSVYSSRYGSIYLERMNGEVQGVVISARPMPPNLKRDLETGYIATSTTLERMKISMQLAAVRFYRNTTDVSLAEGRFLKVYSYDGYRAVECERNVVAQNFYYQGPIRECTGNEELAAPLTAIGRLFVRDSIVDAKDVFSLAERAGK